LLVKIIINDKKLFQASLTISGRNQVGKSNKIGFFLPPDRLEKAALTKIYRDGYLQIIFRVQPFPKFKTLEKAVK